MNDCVKLRPIVPLLTGGELESAVATRVRGNLAGCPRCAEEEADFRRLREMARAAKRVEERGWPDTAGRQIARAAAQRLTSRPWLLSASLAARDVPFRPALATLAAAAVLVALLAVPQAFNRGGSPPATERAMRIDVVAEAGQV